VLSVPMLTLAGEPMGRCRPTTAAGSCPTPASSSSSSCYAPAGRRDGRAGAAARRGALARRARAPRGEQLRQLADAALALSAAPTLDDLLRLVTEAAREVVGCHQGVGSRLPNGWADATTFVSLSERYAGWRSYDVVPKGLGVLNAVTRENRPLRPHRCQLAEHPEFRGLRDAPGHPPLPDYLAAPLVGRDGTNLGILQLSHRVDEQPFSAEDEAVLVQLAQMTSSSVERLEAYERERAPARRPSAPPVCCGCCPRRRRSSPRASSRRDDAGARRPARAAGGRLRHGPRRRRAGRLSLGALQTRDPVRATR
jgi:hypothetical protein